MLLLLPLLLELCLQTSLQEQVTPIQFHHADIMHHLLIFASVSQILLHIFTLRFFYYRISNVYRTFVLILENLK